MFEQLFKRPSVVARHANAPFADERRRYLAECARRGDSRSTLSLKAQDLFWVALKLSVYPNLHVTIQQVRAVAHDWKERERVCGHGLNTCFTRARFVHTARVWLRYLGYFPPPLEPVPFQPQLDEYCSWAKHERGLSDATIKRYHHNLKHFLRWYGMLERPLAAARPNDLDAYLAHGSQQAWCRITVKNVAEALRAFFRYCALRRWTRLDLANAIQGPRLYALEGLPTGPDWADVRRLFAALDASRPKDMRDRAILMLFAIYGLREGKVAKLRLDHLDWEHDRLQTPKSPLRALVFRTLLLLLYGTGMRIGEALSLTLHDVDLVDAVITVRDAKFFKTRLVPTGPKLTRELAAYARRRRRQLPVLAGEASAFFAIGSGKRWHCVVVEELFRRVRKLAGVEREGDAHYQPRIHDIRHTAAQHRLVTWYRAGADVQRLLPQLATYLGHVNMDSTGYYLSMTPELLHEASQRFEHYAQPENCDE